MTTEIADTFQLTKTYDGPGRGRKLCPACNTYIGVRNEQCNCGHIFVKGETKPTDIEDTPTRSVQMFAFRMGFSNGRICTTPADKFDTQLDSLSQNGVVKFCDDAIEEYEKKRQVLLSPDAIKYLGRYHLKLEGDELELFKMYVDEWFATLTYELEN